MRYVDKLPNTLIGAWRKRWNSNVLVKNTEERLWGDLSPRPAMLGCLSIFAYYSREEFDDNSLAFFMHGGFELRLSNVQRLMASLRFRREDES